MQLLYFLTGTLTATAIGSLGAPAAPSIQALVTLAASPSELGRVLAGFSILECTGVAIRNPVLLGIYTATLEVAPKTIWFFTAVSPTRLFKVVNNAKHIDPLPPGAVRVLRVLSDVSPADSFHTETS